jgi:hypothetical protein
MDDMFPSCYASDNAFGPAIDARCRGGFDFTLLFEHIFLSIAPSAVLLLVLPFRLASLCRSQPVVRADRLCLAKLVISILPPPSRRLPVARTALGGLMPKYPSNRFSSLATQHFS